MQQAADIYSIRRDLLSNLDNQNNVISVQGVLGALAHLEVFPMTKELLEQTRLGKYVNELRKKTSDTDLARRAKDLVKKWQVVVSQSASAAGQIFQNREGGLANGRHSSTPISMTTPSPTLLNATSSSSQSIINNKIHSKDKKSLRQNGPLANHLSSPNLSSLSSESSSAFISNVNNKQPLPQTSSSSSPYIFQPIVTNFPSASSPSLPLNNQVVINGYSNNKNNKKRQLENVPSPAFTEAEGTFKKKIKLSMNNNHINHNNYNKTSPKNKSNVGNQKLSPFSNNVSNNNNHYNQTNNQSEAPNFKTHNNKNSKSIPLNGTYVNGLAKNLENKMFFSNASSDDLKVTITSKPLLNSSTPPLPPNYHQNNLLKKSNTMATLPNGDASSYKTNGSHLGYCGSSSSAIGVMKRNSKVETTGQLLEKMMSKESLLAFSSPTIAKITNNEIIKETVDDDLPIVPPGAKPRPHKKKTSDNSMTKNELVQKYLQSVPSNSAKYMDSFDKRQLKDEKEEGEIEEKKELTFEEISKLDPSSDEYKKALVSNPWAFLPSLDTLNISDRDQKEENRDRDTTDSVWSDEGVFKKYECEKELRVGVEGQFDFKNDWQPWTNSYSVKSYNDDYFPIFPYVSLDF